MKRTEKPIKSSRFLVDGRPASPGQYKRIVDAPSPPANKDDLATKPIHSVVRAFKLMR